MAYIGKQPIVGNFVKLDAITTSATTTFNLLNGGVAYYPQSANNCLVSLNGILQAPTDSFTISGSTIVFSSALTTSDVIDFIIVLGDVLNIGTPSDATVGFSKVTSNLITGATAETSIDGADSVLIYDDSASALRKMTRTNFVSGVGGTNTPSFAAGRVGSGQTISGALTEVIFDTERFDTNSCYNTTNGRFTPTTAGKYFVYASLTYNNISTVYSECRICKNGSGTAISYGRHWNDTGYHSSFAYGIADMNGSTDYLSVFTYHEHGSNRDIFHDADGSASYFGAYKLIGV